MKISKLFVLVFASFAGMLLASCKNGGSVAVTKNLFVGKWKIVKITTEENDAATGAADDNNVVVTFNIDGAGSSSSVDGGNAFSWSLAENSAYLNITDSGSAHMIALLLTKTSSTSFTVKDTSTHPAQWETFKKQDDK